MGALGLRRLQGGKKVNDFSDHQPWWSHHEDAELDAVNDIVVEPGKQVVRHHGRH